MLTTPNILHAAILSNWQGFVFLCLFVLVLLSRLFAAPRPVASLPMSYVPVPLEQPRRGGLSFPLLVLTGLFLAFVWWRGVQHRPATPEHVQSLSAKLSESRPDKPEDSNWMDAYADAALADRPVALTDTTKGLAADSLGFTIQIAAFADSAAAQAMATAEGASVWAEGNQYKVLLGRFASLELARSHQAQQGIQGFPRAWPDASAF